MAAGIAAMLALALSIFGGIHLARDANPDPRPVPIHGKIACSNGHDDDGDGLIDFVGHDPGCSSPKDRSEKDPACSDGKDNDTDGQIDFGHDAGCSSLADISEKNPACSNGKDDDHDGLTDFAGHDPGCESPDDRAER